MKDANSPWAGWTSFRGSFDYSFWDATFEALHGNGISAARVWVTCNGAGIIIPRIRCRPENPLCRLLKS